MSLIVNPAYLFSLAYKCASERSTDRSSQNGAVLVDERNGSILAVECNRFPARVLDVEDRHQRPKKYAYVEHAERNVIYACARQGIPTVGMTMYVPWYACADCARAIIQAGIRKVVGHKQIYDKTTERWRESIADGDVMLKEAGIECIYLDIPNVFDPKLDKTKVLFDGEYWTP